MAVKRHTIWLEDEEWAAFAAQARALGTNPSGLVRVLLGQAPVAALAALAAAGSEGPAGERVLVDEVPALTTSTVPQEEAFVRPTATTSSLPGIGRQAPLGGTFGASRPAPKGGTKR